MTLLHPTRVLHDSFRRSSRASRSRRFVRGAVDDDPQSAGRHVSHGSVASVSGLSGTGAGIGTIAATLLTGVVADRYSFEPMLIGASLVPARVRGSGADAGEKYRSDATRRAAGDLTSARLKSGPTEHGRTLECGHSPIAVGPNFSSAIRPIDSVRSDAHRVAVVDNRANHARSSIPVVGEVATWWHQPSNLAAIQIDERGAGSDPPGEPCGRPTAVGFELAVHAADKVEALTAKSPDARRLAIGKKTRDRYPRRASMALSFLERVSENAGIA